MSDNIGVMKPEQYKRLRKELDETMKAFNDAAKEAAIVITEFAAAIHYAVEELEKAKRP